MILYVCYLESHQINPNEKKVVFDESDEQWIKYRHCHIADLSK